LFSPLAIAVALVAIDLLLALRRRPQAEQLFYPLVGLGMLAVAYLSRRKAGGFLNDLIPAYAFIAVLFGLAVFDLRRGWGPLAARAPLSLLCFAQFPLLFYDPRAQLPTAADRR